MDGKKRGILNWVGESIGNEFIDNCAKTKPSASGAQVRYFLEIPANPSAAYAKAGKTKMLNEARTMIACC
jgi:hypothetical protein